MRVFLGALRSVRGAVCAAAYLFLAHSPDATADEQSVARPEELRTVLFGSLDAGQSTFGTLGIKRTLSGPLDITGPVGMASLGYGRTVERLWGQPDEAHVIRHAVHASALLGYQWVRDGIVVAAFAGPEIDIEQLSDRAVPRVRDPHAGARVHGEIWAHPTANTLLTATVIAGTARTAHLWGRASAGYALWDRVFVGPEAAVYATDTYRELRLGGHVTGLTFGALRLPLSARWRG